MGGNNKEGRNDNDEGEGNNNDQEKGNENDGEGRIDKEGVVSYENGQRHLLLPIFSLPSFLIPPLTPFTPTQHPPPASPPPPPLNDATPAYGTRRKHPYRQHGGSIDDAAPKSTTRTLMDDPAGQSKTQRANQQYSG